MEFSGTCRLQSQTNNFYFYFFVYCHAQILLENPNALSFIAEKRVEKKTCWQRRQRSVPGRSLALHLRELESFGKACVPGPVLCWEE